MQKLCSYFHRNQKNKKWSMKSYSFLLFFFSTFRHPPKLGVVVTMESWFSVIVMRESLSESNPSNPWVLLLPDISFPVVWRSYFCSGLLGFSSCVCVLGCPFCSSFSPLNIVVSVVSSSSSNGSVFCHPLGFLFAACSDWGCFLPVDKHWEGGLFVSILGIGMLCFRNPRIVPTKYY